ncbi:type II toxin-antitoxin system HigB family toxin [Rhizobium sp. LjRoot254]|uniref:type II toxin-antitoxin system HigB family toxin n=1 Tax=Rhizobium sp. LjRoot254 TaxID=3342297 RepID=UPI003ECC222F
MQIIAFSTLRLFWQRHPQAEGPLRAWFNIASRADWTSPADIKRDYGSNVDFVGDNRVIFDIAGNKYRLIVRVAYQWKSLQIKFVGTHSEYDKINAETIGR